MFWIPKVGYGVKLVQSTRGKIIFGTFIVLLLAAGLLLGEDDKKVSKRGKELTLEITDSDIRKKDKEK